MEVKKLQSSIYIDPLTGLPNFFKFIELDFVNIFHENGNIIIFNIAHFSKLNETRGIENYDLYLKSLNEAIGSILLNQNEALIFRTHGDEITIIIPESRYSEIVDIGDLIKEKFRKMVSNYSLYDIDLYILIMSYNNKIHSIENYYELLLNYLTREIQENNQNKVYPVNFLKHIIGGIINRVKDTLIYYNDAQYYAFVDDISGIQNHRAGRLYLTNLIEEFKERSGISVLFIDGDNLKRYNNINYEAGNAMIRNLSKIISDTIRQDDKVYRWLSGDEFLVVLKETNEIKALSLAERIRQAVEKETKDLVYPITVSIGVANYPKDGNSIDEIINKAEKANSVAKNSGKNKVVIWST